MEFKRDPNIYTRIRKPARPVNNGPVIPHQEPISNDISVNDEMENGASFRDILFAWLKQSVKNSPLENWLQNIKKPSTKGKLKSWKDDLKWALQADLDEPVKPARKQPKSPVQSAPVSHAITTALTGPHPTALAAQKTIDININFGSIPKVHLPNLDKIKPFIVEYYHKLTKKQLIILGGIIAAAILLVYGIPYIQNNSLPGTVGSNGISSKTNKESPNYPTILPAGKSIDQLGGWARVSPPDRNPVFAYIDVIGKVKINVSEQPLPDSFKSNPGDQVKQLASAYTANDKITAGDVTVYIGTSSKGPQSVIFTKNNLLVLIKSTDKINDKSWGEYIQTLR